VTPEPKRDYLAAYTEKEVRERLQRATPREEAPTESAPVVVAETTKFVQEWVRSLVNIL
jgi:hypothetical protein